MSNDLSAGRMRLYSFTNSQKQGSTHPIRRGSHSNPSQNEHPIWNEGTRTVEERFISTADPTNPAEERSRTGVKAGDYDR